MKTRLEADEVAAQLERCDKENKILKDEMNKEIEAVLLPFLAFFPHPIPCPSVCPSRLPSPSLLWIRKTDRCSYCWAGPSTGYVLFPLSHLHSLVFLYPFSLLVLFFFQFP